MQPQIPWRALALSVCTLVLSGPALATEFAGVDAAHSSLQFSYTEMGVALQGHFSQFTAKLNFDPAKPEAAHAAMDVALASVDGGSAEATAEVAGKAWFDTAHNPTAHFESTQVQLLSPGHYQLSGNLTLKGHTHAVVVPLTYTAGPSGAMLDGVFSFNRTDYGVGDGEWTDTSIVANPIQVHVHLALSAAR